MSVEKWRSGLSPLPVHLRYFESTGSTNDEAIQWAASGAAEYSLVVANHQTTGRGRMQRKWITKPGTALAFSLILHPTPEEARHITLFSPLVAMALCAALSGYPALQEPGCCNIKWPNDVLLKERKTAGVLVECSWFGDEMQGVVIGMGVNVNQGSVPVDVPLLFPATCVEDHAGVAVDRIDLLYRIIEQVIHLRSILLQPEFVQKYEVLLAFKGRNVVITQENQPAISGVVSGIQPDGDLILKTDQDQFVSVSVGDVHLRPV